MTRTLGTVLCATALLVLAVGSVQAEGEGACDTDYNGDGVTNSADLKVFQAALGSQAVDESYLDQADHDGDGQITTLDYGILLDCAE